MATCQRAGIRVRMVTGDNIHTARHIARECGILTEGGVAIEGPQLRAMTPLELVAALPSIQVIARSSPQDKYLLVETLKRMGEVVAVTGDGTNDAPALKVADVGLAMGIAGTEVAKEAADIVILDDNFSSIVKSVLWGRTVFANIRKFLQFQARGGWRAVWAVLKCMILVSVLVKALLCRFATSFDCSPSDPVCSARPISTAQLTINFVALVIAFVAAITTGETPLNVIQLLWVNLIMDSLAALALATELPTPGLLDRRPHGRNEPLVNRTIAKHILVQGAYQLVWLFLIFYGLPAQFSAFAVPSCEEVAALTEPVPGSCFAPQPGDSKLTADQYCEVEQDKCQEKANSMVFNTFIWMQMFNMVCSRRIADEYTIFNGIGGLFACVWVVIAALQVVIMLVEPIGNIFHVVPQSGVEWVVSLAIGVGTIGVSMITRLLSRTVFKLTPEQEAAREAELAARPILFREHFWQILRPVRPKDSLVGVGADAGAPAPVPVPAAYREHFWQITRPRRPEGPAPESSGRRHTVLASAARSFARLLPRSCVQ